MRLQIFISRSGACSRRKALELIKKGAVAVNDKPVAEPSFSVEPKRDRVVLWGRQIFVRDFVYIMLNKPKGVITTCSDRYAERTVLDLLPQKFHHLYPVGRLDKDTEGLLILTNHGELTHRLTHPRFNIDKKYFVCIRGRLTDVHRNKLEKGLVMHGVKTSPSHIEITLRSAGSSKLYITIHEGKKRQIKQMFSALGYKVFYLKRISEGPLKLSGIKKGKWRLLQDKEIESLQDAAGLQ